ncbi:MAG: putative quinol monooxygenase [Acidimicrobiia bacterium]|jgi:quinol monooxygenase YgiN
MIVLVGWIDVDPDKRAEVLAASAPLQQGTREDEPGCLAYTFAPDPLHEQRIGVHEAWTDAESLQAHFAHVNYRGMLELLGSADIRGMDVAKHDVVRSAAVYRPDGVPDASWWG